MFYKDECPKPKISIIMPFMRPCFENQSIIVEVANSNLTSSKAKKSIVKIKLDDRLTFQTANHTYSNLGNNEFSFQIDSLDPGETKPFVISAKVDCNVILGETICMEAEILDPDSCVVETNKLESIIPGCVGQYDSSEISMTSKCIGDTVIFLIANTGNGATSCYLPMRLFIDGSLMAIDSIFLAAGDSIIKRYSSDGRTYWMEINQHPYFPTNKITTSFVEKCGDETNFTSGIVGGHQQNDIDPYRDVYCGVVKGSYDPNDKSVLPSGIGTNNYVNSTGELSYLVRFQNTGTDTAFTVVVRDTLSDYLNISSVITMSSSHKYSFRIYDNKVLEWTFSNILLPDSNTNEPLSHGYISFIVEKADSLMNGDVISNSVAIYFDFNDPVITNLASVEIKKPFNVQSTKIDTVNVSQCSSYSRNGITYEYSGLYYQRIEDSLVVLDLKLKSRSDTVAYSCKPFLWYGAMYNKSGVFEHNLSNSNGCDSTVYMKLTIGLQSDSVIEICEPFLWYGLLIDSSGLYKKSLTSSLGCDSTINLSVVFNSDSSSDYHTTCNSTFEWNNKLYSKTGQYFHTALNEFGCDSILSLHLTILPKDTLYYFQTACKELIWNGKAYIKSGIIKSSFSNEHSCSNTVYLDLTILNESVVQESICNYNSLHFALNDSTYTGFSQYNDTITSVNGCDSIIQWTLNVPQFDSSTVMQPDSALYTSNVEISSSYPYENYYDYQWFNCISQSAISNNVGAKYYPTEKGMYSVIVKRDGCVDTTQCYDYSPTMESFNEIERTDVSLFPNPSTGMVQIASSIIIDSVFVIDATGKSIYNLRDVGGRTHILNFATSGMYFIRITTKNGSIYRKIVIQ
jgi:hypothetical protein